MLIANFNLNGEKKRIVMHFASIVRLALVDDALSENEEKMLKRLARRFHILGEHYKEILKEPEQYAIATPHSYDVRIERLFDLVTMIYADKEVTGDEARILRRIGVGIGFSVNNVEKVTDEAIHLILNNNSFEDFKKAIKEVNKI